MVLQALLIILFWFCCVVFFFVSVVMVFGFGVWFFVVFCPYSLKSIDECIYIIKMFGFACLRICKYQSVLQEDHHQRKLRILAKDLYQCCGTV